MDIAYQNLRIRNAGAQDAAQLAAWWNDGAVMAHAGFPKGLGTTAEKIARELQTDTDETYRRLILEVDSAPVGEMNYRNLRDGRAEIGVKICETSQQGKGYGRVFLSMLIAALFEKGYQTIVLDTNLNNKRAQHVYETLGFQKLRVNHDAWVDQLGAAQSSVDYALKSEQFVNFAKQTLVCK